MGSGNELSTYDTGQMFLEVIDGSAEAAKLVKRDEQRFAAWPRNLNMNTEKLESCCRIRGRESSSAALIMES